LLGFQRSQTRQNPNDLVELRFAVLARERPREGNPCHAVVEHLVHTEVMLWHVIERPDDHHVASLDHGLHENIQTIDPTIQMRTSTPGGVRRSTQRTPIPKYALGNKKTPARRPRAWMNSMISSCIYFFI
jgi:hypothetical protein